MTLETGMAKGVGTGGRIDIRVGKAMRSDGEPLSLQAGNSSGNTWYGGAVNIKSGTGDTLSGDINLLTPGRDEGSRGGSGQVRWIE